MLAKGDGFALLASCDTKGDGVVDANSDGQADDGELITPADAGRVNP